MQVSIWAAWILRAGQAADVLARLRLRPIAARIATDAFGNALGNSIAESMSGVTVRQSGDELGGWTAAGRAMATRYAQTHVVGPTYDAPIVYDDDGPAWGVNQASTADPLPAATGGTASDASRGLFRPADYGPLASDEGIDENGVLHLTSTGEGQSQTFLPSPTVVGMNAQGGEIWSSGAETYPVVLQPQIEMRELSPWPAGNGYANLDGSPINKTNTRGPEWQASAGFSGLGGFSISPALGGFAGGGLNFGFNSSGQVFVQIQGTLSTGVGAYIGAGAQYGLGYNWNASCSGDSGWQPSLQADANLGSGASRGGSVQVGQDGVSGQVGGKSGVGYGVQVSLGVTLTRTWSWQIPYTSAPQKCGPQ